MKLGSIALIVSTVALSGCFAGEQTFHIQGVQCEPMPWDGDAYGGSDGERLARLRSHYEGAGVDVLDVELYSYDVMVTAVCGAWDTKVYEITVDGRFDEAAADGWAEGPAPEKDRL